MIQKKSLIEFLRNVIEIFGISVICLVVFSYIFGNDAKEISTIFEYANKAISLKTMLQFLLLSILLRFLKEFFYTDKIIKKLSITARAVGMIFSIVIVVGIFAAIFGWFPVNMFLPWLMFFISFSVCTIISGVITGNKEKNENEKLQKALEKLKKEMK